MRGQPGAPEVRRDHGGGDAEEDRRAEPPEQAAVQVRAVVQAQLLADPPAPARTALARLAQHAVPRKRRPLRREVLVKRAAEPAVAGGAVMMTVVVAMAVMV